MEITNIFRNIYELSYESVQLWKCIASNAKTLKFVGLGVLSCFLETFIVSINKGILSELGKHPHFTTSNNLVYLKRKTFPRFIEAGAFIAVTFTVIFLIIILL